jgi:hypothetical protein
LRELSDVKRFSTPGKVIVLVLMAGIVAAFLLPHEDIKEPVLEEKPLSAWLEDLKYGTGDARNQAAEVLRRSGTNALPALLQMIRSEDSRVKLALIKLARKQSLLKIDFALASERRSLAVGGFEALGSLAKPAIPKLTQLSKHKSIRPDAVRALHAIESDLDALRR